jgi:hypothetical protein
MLVLATRFLLFISSMILLSVYASESFQTNKFESYYVDVSIGIHFAALHLLKISLEKYNRQLKLRDIFIKCFRIVRIYPEHKMKQCIAYQSKTN